MSMPVGREPTAIALVSVFVMPLITATASLFRSATNSRFGHFRQPRICCGSGAVVVLRQGCPAFGVPAGHVVGGCGACDALVHGSDTLFRSMRAASVLLGASMMWMTWFARSLTHTSVTPPSGVKAIRSLISGRTVIAGPGTLTFVARLIVATTVCEATSIAETVPFRLPVQMNDLPVFGPG